MINTHMSQEMRKLMEAVSFEEDVAFNYMPQRAVKFHGISSDLLDDPLEHTTDPDAVTVLKIENAERLEYIFKQLAKSAKLFFSDYSVNDDMLKKHFLAALLLIGRTGQEPLAIKAVQWLNTSEDELPGDWVVENL